ncbi:hypothetical protein BH11VER1_BH11VER1_04720 [soil metagenome]
MKATLEIPDDLYRRVKARSALEGRPLRSVAVQLFQSWLNHEIPPPAAPPAVAIPANRKPTRFDNAPWLALTRTHLRPEMSHDMADIDEAIAQGWAEEQADKLHPSSLKS